MNEEQQLLQALRAGDEHAFRRLVERYQDAVLNTCLGFLPGLHDAEDLTQEVFVEVWRSLDGFRGEARLSTWIYRLAVNKSLELLRSRKRKKRLGFFWALAGLDDASAQQAIDEWNHPGVALEQKDRARVLFSAMERLPDKQRSALVLQKMEGLNQTEIAGILGVSVASVESLLHRAKKNLHTLLLKHYQFDSL